jgi:ATP-dependent RNA helicase RhlE
MSSFSDFNLFPTILKSIEEKGYLNPTPIQRQAIPHLLMGKDLLGIAQTGTGKTAAFSLPIIDRIARKNVRVPKNKTRALILTPTRELATQIEANINSYGQGLKIRTVVIFGGVGYPPQIRALRNGLDVLIATPGRLLDLMNKGHISYEMLEVFVLDEADQMLDMGFINDIKKIIKKIPEKRQTLLFSATMPKDISVLANSLLNKPVLVEVTPQATTVEKIDQRLNLLEKSNKPILLRTILKNKEMKKVLVFTRTKHGANKIVEILEKENIASQAIHGNKSQNARERALANFKEGNLRVLIATDIAARGIDIPNVTHVINYNLPEDPKSYVHRIGRTARAGTDGVAISFCDGSELSLLKSIEKFIRFSLPVDKEQPFHEIPVATASNSRARIRKTKFKRHRKKSKKSSSGHGKSGTRRF